MHKLVYWTIVDGKVAMAHVWGAKQYAQHGNVVRRLEVHTTMLHCVHRRSDCRQISDNNVSPSVVSPVLGLPLSACFAMLCTRSPAVLCFPDNMGQLIGLQFVLVWCRLLW